MIDIVFTRLSPAQIALRVEMSEKRGARVTSLLIQEGVCFYTLTLKGGREVNKAYYCTRM